MNKILSGKREALTTAIIAALRHSAGWADTAPATKAQAERLAGECAELIYPRERR